MTTGGSNGAAVMARPKGRPKGKAAANIPQAGRLTIINLKGSPEQAQWLDDVHRGTHIPKSVIVRLALTMWAEKEGHPAFPAADDAE